MLLLPAVVLLMCCALWLSYWELRAAANAAYDRSLAGAIRGIDARISTDSGGLGVELPYQMLEFFTLTVEGKVFYRIATEDGMVTLGNADLPAPPQKLRAGVPYFYDADYFGDPVRIGAYTRRLEKPLYSAGAEYVIIQVAESTRPRIEFAKNLLWQSITLNALLVPMIALLMIAAVVLALRPLARVREAVLARANDDLTPMDPTQVPHEVRPLVEAINHQLTQWIQLAKNQRQFLDDAAHQLRTPLSVLRTQTEYALREPDQQRVNSALLAIRSGIERSTRLVNQLLVLARVRDASSWVESTERLNLAVLVKDAAQSMLLVARGKRQDFAFIEPSDSVVIEVAGVEVLLREAVTNLVDNAIKYAPLGGSVSISVDREGDQARVTVSDNGPGIPADEHATLGERFRRGKTASEGGAGLGLAIAKAIMEEHHGSLRISERRDEGTGLTVELVMPIWSDH